MEKTNYSGRALFHLTALMKYECRSNQLDVKRKTTLILSGVKASFNVDIGLWMYLLKSCAYPHETNTGAKFKPSTFSTNEVRRHYFLTKIFKSGENIKNIQYRRWESDERRGFKM